MRNEVEEIPVNLDTTRLLEAINEIESALLKVAMALREVREGKSEMTEPFKCTCVSTDRFECWSLRCSKKYRMLEMVDDVEADGGPCECHCHYRFIGSTSVMHSFVVDGD